MEAMERIEHAVASAVDSAATAEAPPGLAAAIRHAVFPGGARVRPRLSLAVACACGDDAPALADAAAASIELLHCASLVHDDMPCFDNAATRRGKPSVHKAFGERLALLAGDALIVLAFETLARGAAGAPHRLGELLLVVSGSVGMPTGISAGQAWECEPCPDLSDYHRAKTGSLFAAATISGALAAGARPERWRALGERIGEAYQVADDIWDVAADPDALGKPVGQDQMHGRPSAVAELGLDGAIDRLRRLVADAVASVPDCPGRDPLRAIIVEESRRFLPKELARRAA